MTVENRLRSKIDLAHEDAAADRSALAAQRWARCVGGARARDCVDADPIDDAVERCNTLSMGRHTDRPGDREGKLDRKFRVGDVAATEDGRSRNAGLRGWWGPGRI